MLRFIALVLIAVSLVSPARVKASDADLVKTAQALFKDLRHLTLDNGLRVYLLPVRNAPLVSVMMAYRVGSADEQKDQTGLSHYLEHLMFKGTDTRMPGDIDRVTQRNGGRNNAFTSEDMTVYFFDFAADRWLVALEIEADRMRNLRIDEKHEFQQEKGAVIAELDGNEDSPGDLEYKALLPLLFPKDSPYSHPVIGQREHVRGATAEIIKRYYDQWYHPNNAALVVVGGFDPDQAMEHIKKLLGPIPRADLPPRKQPTFYPTRDGPVRKEFESKFDVPRLLMGFNTVAVGHPDDPVLDVIQTLLADGRTSRLYRKLVESERVATAVDAGNYSGRYPGWFGVSVELLKGKDRQKVEEMVFAELERLSQEPIRDEELARARKKLLAGFVLNLESVNKLAEVIARTSAYPGREDVGAYFREYLDRILAVSKADIQRVARQYLNRKNAAVVWSVPKEPTDPQAGGTRSSFTQKLKLLHSAGRGMGRLDRQGSPAAGGSRFSLAAAKRVVLPNGLTVLMLEDHRVPVVVAAVEIKDVQLWEPPAQAGIATLMGSLLDEGTQKHTGKEIAELIENTGGTLSLRGSGGSLKVLSSDADLGLNLLFECLLQPTFPAEAFDRQKEQQLSIIADNQTQPEIRAQELFQAIVYGDHPFGRPATGRRATVERLTADDCKAFHKLVVAPNFTTIALVGDFQTEQMIKTIDSLTRNWKPSDAPRPMVPAPPKATAVTEKIVSDPTAAQVHVYIGHLGITRNNPDYYKLLVMDNVLGLGTGFTARLPANLRDRLGLAYTVTAAITNSAGTEPGTFVGYIGTFPNSFRDVRHGFLKELDRIRDERPSQQEVEDAKSYLLGSLPFRFATTSGIASQLLAVERYGLGFDFLETYQKQVAAVTPDDVQAVARKYLNPKALTIVAVGAIDSSGKPLEKK
jgi:zinc protease